MNPKIPSRGIPSKESLWLADVRKLRSEWKYHQNVRLELDQILQLIFPPQYQARYYEVALAFMNALLSKPQLYGDDVGLFLKQGNYSKATFYNVILPRLKRLGLVSTQREVFAAQKSKQKYYKQIFTASTQFSIFWQHVAREYEAIVATARLKQSDNATQNPQN